MSASNTPTVFDSAAVLLLNGCSKQIDTAAKTISVLINKVTESEPEKLKGMLLDASKAMDSFTDIAEKEHYSKAVILMSMLSIVKVTIELLSEDILSKISVEGNKI